MESFKKILMAIALSGPNVGFGYFVEWSHMPGVPVFVSDWKVQRAN
ncbi:hypothetical protein [Bradyrhizobium lablabi]|nr:hypothetical protein [Bradyrhizobium lablabi]